MFAYYNFKVSKKSEPWNLLSEDEIRLHDTELKFFINL